MYQLSLNDINLIKSDISRQRVSYSHLLDDLVDHVCCDVELEMNSGLPFKTAYSKVKSRIGNNRFKKIQEETLLLIDKNYKTMKNFMKIFGVLSPALLSLAALFKIQHWPGGSVMMVLGFFFLCFFFLPSSVYVLYIENKSSKKHLLMQLSGLISSIIFLIGILFKVQHWPGASILISSGLVLIAFVFLPSLVFSKISDDKGEGKKTAYLLGLFAGVFYIAGYMFKMQHWPGASVLILIGLILSVAIFLPAFSYANFKDETYVSGRYIFLVVAVMMAVIFISLFSLNVSKNVFNEFVVAETQIDNLLQDLRQKNTLLTESLNAESMEKGAVLEIHSKTGEIETWIHKLKYVLIVSVDPNNSEAISGTDIDYKYVNRKDEMNIPAEILFGSENNGKVYQLKRTIKTYKEFLLTFSNEPELVSSIELLLDISEEEISEKSYSWEQFHFEHRTLMSILNSLTTIQLQLRLSEKEILRKLSKTEFETAQNIITEANKAL